MLSTVNKPPDDFATADHQPIGRVVGKRQIRPIGAMPDAMARAAMVMNANYRTRTPKGIFCYASHEEMNRDRERWTIDAVLARHVDRG